MDGFFINYRKLFLYDISKNNPVFLRNEFSYDSGITSVLFFDVNSLTRLNFIMNDSIFFNNFLSAFMKDQDSFSFELDLNLYYMLNFYFSIQRDFIVKRFYKNLFLFYKTDGIFHSAFFFKVDSNTFLFKKKLYYKFFSY